MIIVNFFSQPFPKQLISLLFNFVCIFCRRYLIFKKNNSQNVSTQKDEFESRLCDQTQ